MVIVWLLEADLELVNSPHPDFYKRCHKYILVEWPQLVLSLRFSSDFILPDRRLFFANFLQAAFPPATVNEFWLATWEIYNEDKG